MATLVNYKCKSFMELTPGCIAINMTEKRPVIVPGGQGR